MISEISDARTRPWVQWRARGRSRAVSPARNGFTLLELLLVLAVLSVLGSLALPQVAWLLGDRRIVRGARLVREELV
ncbi:MAG: prepilin-type N-terminal cleavage/methylation domain-containing protein, partial [Planctomycetota bacterium]